jgi:hypothetical protein
MGLRYRLALLFLCVGLWLEACPVAADGSGAADPARWRAAGELGYIRHAAFAESLTVGSALLSLHYRFAAHFGVGVDWGWLVVGDVPKVGSSLWKVGSSDPLFKLTYARDSEDRTRHLQLSAGVTAPLAWLSYDTELRGLMRSAYAHAAATRGMWNVWLWGPEQTAFVANAAWEQELKPALRGMVEVGAAATVPISQVTRDRADAFAQLAAALEMHDEWVALEIRYQVVAMTSSSDALQQALSACMSAQLGDLKLAARVVVNLDPPLGIFGHGLGMVGLLVSAGGAL